MKSTTSASPRYPTETTARSDDPTSASSAAGVSLPRLYALRLGYLVIAVGLALVKWPLLLNHPQPWPLFEGVETCMLVALSLLWFLGLRYPLQMLPVLLLRGRQNVLDDTFKQEIEKRARIERMWLSRRMSRESPKFPVCFR